MENFAHLPFEEWLLSERSLSAYQEQALNEHLQTCENCRQLKQSWGGVYNLFRSAPQVAPKVGFTARWMERQLAGRLQRQRRQAWIVLAIIAVNALIFLAILTSQIVAMTTSPTQWLLLKMYFVTRYLAVASFVQSIGQAVSQMTIAFPLIGLFFFVGAASFLSVLWVVAYRQLTTQTRRVKS